LRKSKLSDEVGDREVERSQAERAENDDTFGVSPGIGFPHQNFRKRAPYESPTASELFSQMKRRPLATHMVNVIHDVIARENGLR